MKNQNQTVLNHLIDHGYITQSVASNYAVRRLAARVHDLRIKGVNVEVERRVDDAGVPYAYYTLSSIDRYCEDSARQQGLAWNRSRPLFIGLQKTAA